MYGASRGQIAVYHVLGRAKACLGLNLLPYCGLKVSVGLNVWWCGGGTIEAVSEEV